MKEIFLGKPTAKQLEWMYEHSPNLTVVKFKDGKTWTGIMPLDRQGTEGAFCDADMEDAGVFETGPRGDVVSIRVQDGAVSLGGPFREDYASLETMTLPASVGEIWTGIFGGGSLERLVFLGKTQAEAEELAEPEWTGLPVDCQVIGELG